VIYDIIGDIHGYADKLEALLAKLGYRNRNGAWRQPGHVAVFVGDFIDRGPQGVETVRAVRGMVDAGNALAIMGNHELNAIAWHTPDERHPGEYLRRHHSERWGTKNREQHAAFLAQVEDKPGLHEELVDWFLALPLWLDLSKLRVVHACWHAPFMSWLSDKLRDGRYLTRELMVDATTEPDDENEKYNATPSIFKAVEALTKGLEVKLPEGYSFADKDGHTRRHVRVRWWDPSALTYRDAAVIGEEVRLGLPAIPIETDPRPRYDASNPVFFGHYWMTGVPRLQSSMAACVDYSAGKGGPLVAYRHEGGLLSAANFVVAGAEPNLPSAAVGPAGQLAGVGQ
jgi:hypothetical protein